MESALNSVLNSLKSLKLWQMLVLFVVLFGAAGATYEVYGRSTAVPLVALDENQQIIPVQYGDLINKVSTSGNLVFPDREVLSFGSQGTVESILVEEGDRVTRGQPLAQIDQASVARIELAVAQAEFDLDVAQQALDELLSPTDLQLAQARETVADDEGQVETARQALADYSLEYSRDLASAEQIHSDALLDLALARDELANFARDFEQDEVTAQLAKADAQVSLDQALDALADFGPSTLDELAQALQVQADAELASEAAREALSSFPSDYSQELVRAREAEARARVDLVAAQDALAGFSPDYDQELAAAQQVEAEARDALRRAQLALDRYEDSNSRSLSLNRVRRDDLEAQVAQTQADLARLRAESASGVGGLESIINGLEQAELILVPELADTLEALVAVEQLEAAVQVSQAGLDSAELTMARLVSGPDPLRQAELDAETELARSNLDQAIQDLAKLVSGPDLLKLQELEAAVEVSGLTLAKARQNLAELRKGPNVLTQNQLQATVSKARVDLISVEQALLDITSPAGPGSIEAYGFTVQRIKEQLEALKRTSGNSAGSTVQQQIAEGEAKLLIARDNLGALEAGADPLALAVREAGAALAKANLDQAAAGLAVLVNGPDLLESALREQRLSLAEATLAESLEELNELDQGPNPLDATLAKAKLASARRSLEDSLQRREDATLRSPIDGFVSNVNVEEGDQVNANATIVEIVDPAVVEVDGIVDEIDVLLVLVGTRATVTLDALAGQTLEGVVFQIAPAALNQQGVVTFPIKVRLEVPSGMQLREGMTAVADIVLHEELNVLLVPQQAVYGTFDHPVVKLINSEGLVEERPVVLGDGDDFWVSVREGLKEGDRVAMESAEVTTTGSGFRGLRGITRGGGGGSRPSGGNRSSGSDQH
ncbi:MAG: efflux RND transporter periplasmic adaptor subunit [Chloroflexi bacterium]|nr:efflux RND transporter periplasmic adaptor subunit [Chloroflexota bacterium]